MKRFWRLLLVLLLVVACVGHAQAEVLIEYKTEENHGSKVVLPQVTGMMNSFVQDAINNSIHQEGGYDVMLANLQQAQADGSGSIKADAVAHILPGRNGQDVLTVRIEADGRVGAGRPEHRVRALMYQLSDGQRIEAKHIFKNPLDAEEAIQQIVDEHLAPDMSAYLDVSQYFPLPMDNILVDSTGITLYYDAQQLSLLSGRSASLHIHYNEIADQLLLSEGSVLWALRMNELLNAGETSADAIKEDVALGRLPGIPVAIGDNAHDVLEAYPKAADSESFPAGLRYLLEDDRFRGSAVVASEGSIVGILSQRMNLYGLITGQSTEDDVQLVLGAAVASMDMDGSIAEQYRLPEGRLDDYRYGKNTLRLLFTEDHVLHTIWLSATP